MDTRVCDNKGCKEQGKPKFGSSYCLECGGYLVAMKKCECGTILYDHYKFCPTCGKGAK